MKKILFIGVFLVCVLNSSAQIIENKKVEESDINTQLIGFKEPQVRARGVYKSFYDFIRNRPGITDSFYVKTKARSQKAWMGTNSLMPYYSQTNKRIKKVWGFCDGKTAYIYHEGEFFPIQFNDGEYSFIGYDLIDASGGTTAGVVGGAIGGGLYGAIASSKAKNKRIKYKIDSSGHAIHPDKHYSAKALSDESVIIYRRSKKELVQPIEFLINDSIRYAFVPDSFVKIHFENNEQTIKISYGDNFSESIVVNRDFEDEKYFQCTLLESDSQARFIEVETSTGEFDSYRPEKAQKKRDKNKCQNNEQ